jgi:hypothetical protein
VLAVFGGGGGLAWWSTLADERKVRANLQAWNWAKRLVNTASENLTRERVEGVFRAARDFFLS